MLVAPGSVGAKWEAARMAMISREEGLLGEPSRCCKEVNMAAKRYLGRDVLGCRKGNYCWRRMNGWEFLCGCGSCRGGWLGWLDCELLCMCWIGLSYGLQLDTMLRRNAELDWNWDALTGWWDGAGWVAVICWRDCFRGGLRGWRGSTLSRGRLDGLGRGGIFGSRTVDEILTVDVAETLSW